MKLTFTLLVLSVAFLVASFVHADPGRHDVLYFSECDSKPTDDNTLSYRREISVNSKRGEITDTEYLFDGPGCRIPFIQSQTLEKVRFGNERHANIDGGEKTTCREADVTAVKATLTPQSVDAVELFNAGHLCEIADWKINSARDVTGRDCVLFGFAPAETTHYTVMKMQDDKLWVGKSDEGRGESPENRVDVLSATVFKRK